MSLRVLLSRVLPAIAMTTAAMSAFSQVPTKADEDEIIRVDSRLIVIPVSVTDASGNAVLGLTTSDFRLTENGRTQSIESVGSAADVPLEIALLFDISATTSPMFRFQLETAAKFLRDVMRPQDNAAVFSIGSKPILVGPRANADGAVVALNKIEATKEYTAFYDTVAAAAKYLREFAAEGSRRVVLVISDGEDTNSEHIRKAIQSGYRRAGEKINTLDSKSLYQLTVELRDDASRAERERVGRTLQDADAVFYSINPGGSSFHLNAISVYGQENMQLFADATGGSAFLPRFSPIDTKDEYLNNANRRKNAEALDRIFTQLASELRSQYLVQYYTDAEGGRDRFVPVNVSVAGRSDAKVRSRKGFYIRGQSRRLVLFIGISGANWPTVTSSVPSKGIATFPCIG
jgi:Ca-activated chloride channel family protein